MALGRTPQGHIRQGAEDDVDRKADAERRQHGSAVPRRETDCRHQEPDARCRHEALSGAEQVAALPSQCRTDRHGQEQRNEERAEGQIEEGCAHRDFLPRQGFESQRVQGPDQDGGAGCGEKQVVEHEGALA